MLSHFLILLVGLAVVDTSEQFRCVGAPPLLVPLSEGECAVESREPVAETVPFAVVTRASGVVRLGYVGMDASRPVGRDEPASSGQFRIVGKSAERVISPCRLSIAPLRDDEAKEPSGASPARGGATEATPPPTWILETPAERVGAGQSIVAPAGKYFLSLACEGYEVSEARVDLPPVKEPLRVDLPLIAKPQISGRVTLRSGPQSTAAQIYDHEGRLLAQTEVDGTFAVGLTADDWPERIEVRASGFGTAVIDLPVQPSRMDLATIELSRAARVVLKLAADQLPDVVAVDLFTLGDLRKREPYRTVTATELKATELTLEDIPAGKYVVVVRGAEPLQRHGTRLELAAGETSSLAVDLAADDIEIRTWIGEERLPDAQLFFESMDGLWHSELETAGDGSRTSRVWQRGEFAYIVKSAAVPGAGGTTAMTPPVVDIRLPNRTIEGTIVDATTDQPLAGIGVLLRGARFGVTTKSDAEGKFRFAGVEAGSFTVAAGGEGGVSHETISGHIGEHDTVRKVRVVLRQARELELTIRSWNGSPLREARLIELEGVRVASARVTDGSGLVRLPLVGSGSRAIVILGSDGSLHAQRLVDSGSARDGRIEIIVPPPTSKIRIALRSNEGEPIEGIAMALRMNGVLFPPEIMMLVVDQTGSVLRSGPDGMIHLPRVPAAAYEFWPVRSRSDIEAILSGHPGAAPVVLNAGPGENTAELKFARTKPK